MKGMILMADTGKKGVFSGKRNRQKNGTNGGGTTAQQSTTTTQSAPATTTQSAPAPAAQTQQKKPAAPMDIKEIVAHLAGDHGKLRGTVEEHGKELGEQRTELDELKARVDALEGKKKAPADKVVDAFCYYPGGDTSKPLSDPTENFWVAVQAGQTKVVQVKARVGKDGKLVALSPEEAAKYA